RMYAGGEPVITRAYKDIDLVTLKGRGKRVSELMTGMGYEDDRAFNATNGHRRLLYYDPPHGRQVDVFVGTFEMCHSIPITERIDLHASAVPLAELLLTKMQIVELNAKDQADILTILYHHDVAETDAGGGNAVNAARVAQLCAGDWGLWRTTKLNVERTRDALAGSALPPDPAAVVRAPPPPAARRGGAQRRSRANGSIGCGSGSSASPSRPSGRCETASATRCAGTRSPKRSRASPEIEARSRGRPGPPSSPDRARWAARPGPAGDGACSRGRAAPRPCAASGILTRG